jgi:hypothetical protein
LSDHGRYFVGLAAWIVGSIVIASPAVAQPPAPPSEGPAPPEAPAPPEEPAPPGAPVAGPVPVPSLGQQPVSAPSEPVVVTSLPSSLRDVQIHGFISQGAFKSTANNYLGESERGTLEFFEAALNVSTEVTDRLTAGIQFYARDLGPLNEYTPRLDWAYLSYRWREWLGFRAGRVKMPFGLYNEYIDIDSARPFVLLPQSVYPLRNRDFLLAHTGFSLYGSSPEGFLGALDYQFILATIYLPGLNEQEVIAINNKYVSGGQVFWRLPVEGLRLGGSWIHTNLDAAFQIDPATTAKVVSTGNVPPDFDGRVRVRMPYIDLLIGSFEYSARGLLLSAEYSRWFSKTKTSVPLLIPDFKTNAERVYGMLAYRFSEQLQVGTYYSLNFVDANDRAGKKLDPMTGKPRFSSPHEARQHDLALCLRVDLTDNWLVKLEGHYMNGTANLVAEENSDPAKVKKHWMFFAMKTTLSF